MQREFNKIISDINEYRPINGFWMQMEEYVTELDSGNMLSEAVPYIFEFMERYPDVEEGRSFKMLVAGILETNDYEHELLASLKRTPTLMGLRILESKLAKGEDTLCGLCCGELLEDIVNTGTENEEIKEECRYLVEDYLGDTQMI